MEKIKIGVIGAGLAWEKLHYPAYARLTDKFEVAAVCDISMDKAVKGASMAGLGSDKAYDNYKLMMDETDIMAVDLMVPIDQSFEVARDVLAQNKHLIAEKPLAATVEQAKELIKLGKNVTMLVAENIRYDEENNIIKQMLTDRVIGNPVYFIDNHVTEFTKDMLGDGFASKEWRQHPEYDGGQYMDSAIHHIARFRFLFGDVTDVYSHGRHSDVDFCPYSAINSMLTFSNGIAGHYAFFCIGKETQAPLVGLRIFGTHGEIYLEDKDCGFLNVSTKDGEHQVIPYKAGEGYYNELSNFYGAVTQHDNVISTPDKALGDIQVVFDILKSISTNSVISSTNSYARKRRAAK